MLEVLEITKRYGEVQALDGFTLTAESGEIVGLVGHNGAGKTTFVEITCGLIRQDSGTVRVNGVEPAKARGGIGICPQLIGLYNSISVREHLELFGGLSGLRRSALRGAVDELATALHLTPFLNRPAGLLSGGQQRRTQAAVALINHPPLLLLDEPTAGADPETRQALLDVVKQRAGEGATVVYTTHYLQELTQLGASIAVAKKGRVIARGSAAELLGDLPGEVRVGFSDGEVHVSTTDPTTTLVELIKDSDREVESVEVRNPDLDDLYHSLAGEDVR